jgi:choice-of-anchor A domain-containing protein
MPEQNRNRSRRFLLAFFSAFALIAGPLLAANTAQASVVDLGQAGHFALLALTGSIDDSGPQGPQGNPYTIGGDVGVVASGQTFQASGSVTYGGKVYLHSGATYNSSAPGVPQPTMGSGVDNMLSQAAQDAFAASSFASGLAATATYGTINNNLSINEAANGHYVFNIDTISFSGGKALTLNGTKDSTFLLNVSGQITLSPGSILLAGGLTADNVLINYTGNKDIQFSGGGNSSQIFGTILAPNATVGLHPGFVAGSIIANAITMSSGADVDPVPEMTPGSVIFGFLGLVVAVNSRRALGGRVRVVARRHNVRK